MFVHAAQAMGYKVLVLNPDASVWRHRRHDIVVAAYDDMQAVAAFGKRGSGHHRIRERPGGNAGSAQQLLPTPCSGCRALRRIAAEKSAFSDHGLPPVGPFAVIERAEDRAAPPTLFWHPENGNARL